jgi:hypothetical protein
MKYHRENKEKERNRKGRKEKPTYVEPGTCELGVLCEGVPPTDLSRALRPSYTLCGPLSFGLPSRPLAGGGGWGCRLADWSARKIPAASLAIQGRGTVCRLVLL